MYHMVQGFPWLCLRGCNGINLKDLLNSKRFAKEIFGLDKAEDGIQALKAWFDKIGTPTRLEQLGIDDKTLAEIVGNAVQTAIKAKMDKIYTKEAIEAIFALAK